jgi:hypothetical protein
MKANVAIEINDEDREVLANLLDGKVTKRKATRQDIVALCEQHIGALVNQARTSNIVKTLEPKPTLGGTENDLLRIDPEDQAVLAGKPESYIIGWNRVKRRQ